MGAALLCPKGLPLGPGGEQGPSPPGQEGMQVGNRWRPGGKQGAWPGPHFSPSLASPPCTQRSASSGEGSGAGAGDGGRGPCSCRMNPKPMPAAGRGLWGIQNLLLGPSGSPGSWPRPPPAPPQPLLPVPCLPASCHPLPRPGPDPDAGVAAESCKSRASLLKPRERAWGMQGARRRLRRERLLRQCRGSAGDKVGGRRGAWR